MPTRAARSARWRPCISPSRPARRLTGLGFSCRDQLGPQPTNVPYDTPSGRLRRSPPHPPCQLQALVRERTRPVPEVAGGQADGGLRSPGRHSGCQPDVVRSGAAREAGPSAAKRSAGTRAFTMAGPCAAPRPDPQSRGAAPAILGLVSLTALGFSCRASSRGRH